MADRRREPLVAPSRWWLLAALPIGVALSVGVALVVAAIRPPHRRATFTTTRPFPSVADAYVETGDPGRNFGRARELRVGGTTRSYLRFAVPRPRGTVVRARLRLWLRGGARGGFAVRAVHPTRWSEPAITAARRPALGPAVATSGPVRRGGWATADVTRLVPSGGVVDLALTPGGAGGGVFDSREASHPPELVLSTSPASLRSRSPLASMASAVTDVLGATRYRVQARDDRHHALTGLDLVQVAPRRYVGVFHHRSGAGARVRVATSRDVLHWRWRATLAGAAAHPSIAALAGGAFVVAARTPAGVRVQHFADLRSLLDGRADRTRRFPALCPRRAALESALRARGARGPVRHDDDVRLGGERFVLAGARVGRDGRQSSFLFDPRAAVAHPLVVRTPRHSLGSAEANATVIRAPSGAPAVVVTMLIPPAGAAAGESGELVLYRDLRGAGAPARTPSQPIDPSWKDVACHPRPPAVPSRPAAMAATPSPSPR